MIRPLRFIKVVVAAHLFCLSSLAQLAPSLLERASSGDATAMHLIGRATAASGRSVEAYAWFSLAAEYGVETAEKSELFDKLSPAQVTEAARRAEEFRSTHLRGLPPPAKKPAARIVETRRPVEEKSAATPEIAPLVAAPPPVAPAVSRPAPDGQAEAQKARIASLEADLAAARSEVGVARKESEEWSTKLEAALSKAGLERDSLAAEISTLRRDKQRAEESLAQLQARPSLDGQVEAQRTQIARLETDLAAARTEASAAKSEALAASQRAGETGKLQAALAKAGQEKETLSAEIASLRQDRQRAEEARDKLRAEHSAVRSKLETDLTAAQTEARVAKQKAGEATKLETALAQATRERDAHAGEIESLRRDKQRAEESLAQMRARPSLEGKVQEQGAQIAKLEADLAAAQSEVRSAKARAEESTARLEAALAEAGKARDSLSTEIAVLKKDKQRAEESLAQLQARPSLSGEVEAQKARIAKLEADLTAARTETATAKEQSGEAKAQLEAALAKAAQEKSAPPAEIATLRQDRLRAEQARDQLRVDFTAARSKLETDLSAAQAEARSAKAQVVKLEAELAAARSEVRSGKAQIGESTAQLQEALAQANRDLAAAEIRNENLVRELARARPGMLPTPDNANNLRAAPTRAAATDPVDTSATMLPRVHTVDSGENLSIISERYYGTPNRWREIFSANTDVMNSPNQLAPGMKLRIP